MVPHRFLHARLLQPRAELRGRAEAIPVLARDGHGDEAGGDVVNSRACQLSPHFVSGVASIGSLAGVRTRGAGAEGERSP